MPTSKKYLDTEGLSYFWDKIKNYVGDSVANRIHFAVPNEKAASATLTVTLSGVTALSPGLAIALMMPFDSAAETTLNVNSLGAKPIYYQSSTREAGKFPAGSIALLIYEETTAASGCFKAVYSYDGATPDVYQGATASSAGVAGLVPSAPSADREKFLRGDGSWEEVSTAKEVGYVSETPTDQSVAALDSESFIFCEEGSASSPLIPVTTTGNQTVTGIKTFVNGLYGGVVQLGTGESAINPSRATCFVKTVDEDTSFTFSSIQSGVVCCVTVALTNAGNYVVDWPSSVKWTGNETPVLTEDGTDILTFVTFDGGTNWYGTASCIGVTS